MINDNKTDGASRLLLNHCLNKLEQLQQGHDAHKKALSYCQLSEKKVLAFNHTDSTFDKNYVCSL